MPFASVAGVSVWFVQGGMRMSKLIADAGWFLMSAMLTRYLKDFGETKPAAPVVDTDNFADDVFGGFPPDIPQEPAVDVEAERREAYGEGYAAATAELDGAIRVGGADGRACAPARD